MKRIFLAALLLLCLTAPCSAKINVVATLPWIGDIASSLGKDRISVITLVKPNQDPHIIEARPSMVLACRKADIVMYNGLDLEIGYLPLLVESSRNPRIQPGKKGNLDCSGFVAVIEKMATVDRGMGDVHPLGNPHYHLSPTNVGRIVEGVTQVFADMDPGNGQFYRANCTAFLQRLREKEKEWNAVAPRGRKFIAYHKFFEYLARDYDFRIVGYIEEKPGIPPTAAHMERLAELVGREGPDAVLTTSYQERKAPDYLSKKTGVRVLLVPHDTGSTAGAKDWFALMDQVFGTLR